MTAVLHTLKQSNFATVMSSSATMLSIILLLITVPYTKNAPSGLVWCYWAGVAAFSGGCSYGEMMGPCGLVCLRGPGEMCGGAGDKYGVCGHGMECSACNKCSGCASVSKKCFKDEKCFK